MSTEHQKYSTENQAAEIARYALQRGMVIVRTYADEGKSGLKLDGREALQQLVEDVSGGQTDFAAILVYDVSRWGRFQDVDESAHLEYICRRAGISVHYCAEQFENDGSLSATIIKSMKRAMAGEYSRELSAKVFAGQCRLVSLGFRQGGTAGYGLRRHLVDENRQPKATLGMREHKSLQTDRVILVPGPAAEVLTVQRMYRQFVEERLTELEIADCLNREGITTDRDRPWTRGTVHQVLTNEKYIGNNLFNRVSFKLKQRRVRNPPESLVRAVGAFDPIVDQGLFDAASTIIAERSHRFSNEEMLAKLAALHAEAGELSALIIDERDDLPSSSAYRSRFGSLLRAYSLIGFTLSRDYRYIETNRFLRSLYPDLISQTTDGIQRVGGSVEQDPTNDLLKINGEIDISVVIARCLETHAGALRWKIRIDAGLRPDITVAVRMQANNRDMMDYYLLPRLDFQLSALRVGEDNGLHIDAYRMNTLDPLYDLMARTSIRRAA